MAVADRVKDLASNYAQKLSGPWGDPHVTLVASKKGGDFEGYKSMRDVLSGFVAETGAPYIYALYLSGKAPQPAPASPNGWTCSCGDAGNTGQFCSECGKPQDPVIADKEPFFITVDGSKEPDDYGKKNKWEKAFVVARIGTATAGEKAWKDDDGTLMNVSLCGDS